MSETLERDVKNASAFFVWLIDYLGFTDAEECWNEEINLETLKLQVMGYVEDLKCQLDAAAPAPGETRHE
jgi:hypothetical protein